MESTKKEMRENVASKLGIANDLKEAQITTNIDNVEKVDGKVTASFAINGLPVPKEFKGDSWEKSHKRIKKIFNNFQEFASYADEFFEMSDEDLVKLSDSVK